ncbi:hypothetical protein AMAG_05087 [Allomyces macrogynus ATCC 38327]|uniref:B box-type domain-containing protein n=1 Tax=Allomyces macrogynus (strain ATCC 38327) TaxID=578462 RepID=A0A0L0S781_ALLM3|nr:hypothetical protein AMAG_05087 [Allomyces macrogynus ATCC 38327]|eukprot:KNE58276.1 hypothetical protein AMAG_05087 [Allomyces macrogynus ATCC 38327]
MNVIDDLEQLKSESDPVVFCTECDEGICFRCRVADHYPMCAQDQALPVHERDPEDVVLHQMAQINQWKLCPSCRAVVERKDGCNFMMCLCGSGTPYLDLTATVKHQHGRPGCARQLFDVPDEPAPAVVNVPARVHEQIEYAIGALHGLQFFDADPAPRRVPEPWPRGRNGRRRMACGHGDVLHPEDQTRWLPAWLATSYRDFVCHYCWREFWSWGALANHLHMTSAHAVLMCCNHTFKNEEGYLNHLDSVHGGYADNW